MGLKFFSRGKEIVLPPPPPPLQSTADSDSSAESEELPPPPKLRKSINERAAELKSAILVKKNHLAESWEKSRKIKNNKSWTDVKKREIAAISREVKNQIRYFAKHESLLHMPDDKIMGLNEPKLKRIYDELSKEKELTDQLNATGRRINQYEAIAKEDNLKSDIALLKGAYNEYKYKVLSVRKIVVKRLEFVRKRIESEKRKSAKEKNAAAMKKLKENYDAQFEGNLLKKLEAHLTSKMDAHKAEKAEEFNSLKRLESLEHRKMFEAMKIFRELHMPKVCLIKRKPQTAKPVLEKRDIEAKEEIAEAISLVKSAKPEISDKVGYIMDRIMEARKSLENFDTETAKHIYMDLMAIYKGLKQAEKIRVYEALKGLYNDRKIAENLITA